MQKSLAMKPSDESQGYINAIGKLLNKTLPQDWEKARIYIEKSKNKIEWKGAFSFKDKKETSFKLNKNFIANLKKLRDIENVRCPMREITFYRNGKYTINYEHINIVPLKPHEIRKEIEKLKALDLKKTKIENLKKRISVITIGHTKKVPMIPVGQKFYRGVLWPEKPSKIKQLTYPQKSKVDKLHRAGREAFPLFYCSFAKEAVFYELNTCIGDKIALSEWRVAEKLLVNHIGYHTQALDRLGSTRPTPWWGINNNNSELKEVDSIISEFLATEFAKFVSINEEYLYKISIAIAEQHFQQDIFDGLMYPTVAMKGNADNFALKPVSVNKKLILEKVEYIEVKESDRASGYKIALLDFANSFTADGGIEWKGRLPHWVLRKKGEVLHVAVENGKWVARNLKGEIVEPE